MCFVIHHTKYRRVYSEECAGSHKNKQDKKEQRKFFASSYQEFIFYQFYARWRDDLGRRESWPETVERFMQYMKLKLKDSLTEAEYSEVHQAILHQEICPSMRLIWSAGEACEATNVCAYNCAYIAPVSWRDLSEIMYVSMCGAGCGFAVEPHNVEQFPRIKEQTGKPIRWTTKLRIVCVYKITNKSKIYQ